MDITFWVLIIFVIIILAIIWITKQVVRTLFFASAIILIVLIGFGFLVLSDVKDIRNNFPNTPSTFLLTKDNTVISGIIGKFGEEFSPDLLTDAQLTSIQENFAEKNYEAIKGDNFKLIIINKSSFDQITVYDPDLQLTKDSIFSLLESEEPINDYITLQLGEGYSQAQFDIARQSFLRQANITQESQFKSIMFGILLAQTLQEEPLFVFQGFIDEKVIFYPETTAFKALKFLPESMLDSFVIVEGEK